MDPEKFVLRQFFLHVPYTLVTDYRLVIRDDLYIIADAFDINDILQEYFYEVPVHFKIHIGLIERIVLVRLIETFFHQHLLVEFGDGF